METAAEAGVGNDPERVSRTLSDIAHVLASGRGPYARVLRVLELCRKLVPYDQCALLEVVSGGAPRVVMVPEPDARERAGLTDVLTRLYARLVDDNPHDPDVVQLPSRTHLAVPLVDQGEVIGVLFVRRVLGSYALGHLRALSIVAANLGAYLTIPRERAVDSERALELDQAQRRVLHLYEISTLLTRLESIGQTIPALVTIIARTLPLHSAILILEEADRHRTFVWQAEGESAASAQAAFAHAQSAYGYLAGSAVELEGPEGGPRTLPSIQPMAGREQRNFILLPLVVDHRPIFGALQLEGITGLHERDLLFTNAVVNQIAIAVDRQARVEAAQAITEARRMAAEDRKAAAEERQTVAELREALIGAERNWLKAVLDQMPAGVLICDATTGGLMLANKRAHAIWRGLRAQALDAAAVPFEAVWPADRPLARSIATGEIVVDEEVAFVRTDGTHGTLLVTAAPIRNQTGRIVSGVETFHDITERKRAEKAQRFLSEAGERLARSLDPTEKLGAIAGLAVPELADWCVVLMVTETGVLEPLAVQHADGVKMSLAREMLRRYPPTKDRDVLVREVLRSAQAQLFPSISDSMLAANAHDGEHLRMLRALGLRSAMVVPLVTRGRVIGELSLASAESGRRFDHADLELAQELARRAGTAIENAQLYVLAQRASLARDDLLAVVSHDLKNPLSTIVMSASELLRTLPTAEDKPTQTWRNVATRIHRSADRMTRMVSDLLDVVRVEAGRLVIEKQRHGVFALVEEVIEMQHPLADARSIVLRAEIRAADDLHVICDRGRIFQVFANLIGNAIKFTPEGGSITVRVEPMGPELQFAVTDTGPGIPADAVPHVFERFWQVQKTALQGNGLGLSIASGIVEMHGGRIWLESQVGVGTTFFFTIPLS